MTRTSTLEQTLETAHEHAKNLSTEFAEAQLRLNLALEELAAAAYEREEADKVERKARNRHEEAKKKFSDAREKYNALLDKESGVPRG
jgi:chromosome segregation ATPase